MANHYDDVSPMPPAPVSPAPPSVGVGAKMAFIDSDGIYQECVVRSVLDGYAWVQKTSGKLNTVPVIKLINRKSEYDLFSDEVTSLIKEGPMLENVIKRLWRTGYRKTGGSNES